MESDDPGTVTMVALIAAAVGTGVSAYEAMNQPKPPSAPVLPQPQATTAAAPATADTTAAAAYAQAEAIRKRAGSASTILTSPMGTTGTPSTQKVALGA